tara:strand:+ start:570 stop:827 length:258 start_codon:yes stop_codon:yes gene_type:complete
VDGLGIETFELLLGNRGTVHENVDGWGHLRKSVQTPPLFVGPEDQGKRIALMGADLARPSFESVEGLPDASIATGYLAQELHDFI